MDDIDDEAPVLVDLTALPDETRTGDETVKGAGDEKLPPCPVTILSGFLGSGKTTLIQYILKSPNHGKRIAVIENEFGEGLAVETLIARDGVDPNSDSLQEFIELPNGCICCTVKDSLVATLENLVSQKKDLDYILIEASGMANPGPIASVFWLDDALESRLRLDGIVTLVDVNHILEQLASTEEAAQQIAYADRLLVNKIDCLPRCDSESELTKITDALRRLHPTAPMITTTYSQVPDLDWILNANCFGGAARLEELDALWNNATTNSHSHGESHHSHHHDHEECQVCQVDQQSTPSSSEILPSAFNTLSNHRHTGAVTTLAFEQAGSVSLEKLNSWLAEILWPNQDESNRLLTAMLDDPSKKAELSQKQKNVMHIYRIKGIVSVVHESTQLLDSHEKKRFTTSVESGGRLLDSRRYIVQAVHDLWDVHPASDNLQFAPSDERVGKVVVIGRHLPKNRLEHGFHSCFTEPAGSSCSMR